MDNKETLYDQNKRALDNGIDARISIQFMEAPNGKMSVLSCTITKEYYNDPGEDYVMSLDTPIKDIIKDLIR